MIDTQGDPLTARARLHDLVRRASAEKLDITSFCDQFEQVYNLELDKDELSPLEAKAFGELFDKVAWYSPYPEERRQIPNYVGEDEVLAAVRSALAVLA